MYEGRNRHLSIEWTVAMRFMYLEATGMDTGSGPGSFLCQPQTEILLVLSSQVTTSKVPVVPVLHIR